MYRTSAKVKSTGFDRAAYRRRALKWWWRTRDHWGLFWDVVWVIYGIVLVVAPPMTDWSARWQFYTGVFLIAGRGFLLCLDLAIKSDYWQVRHYFPPPRRWRSR